MKEKARVAARALGLGMKGFVLIGSFLLIAWIAYCITCLTGDFLDFSLEGGAYKADVVLVHC